MAEIDYQHFDPFRTPQWRWQRAEQLAADQAKHHRRRSRPEDPLVLAPAEYLKALAAAETPGLVEAAQRRWPEIALAHAFYRENRATRWMIEAYLLAGLSASVIATRVPLDPAVVECYADLFFDVAGSLGAQDWIVIQAVRAGPLFAKSPDEAGLWRYAAYVGGPFVVDVLIGHYLNKPAPDAPDRAQLAARLRQFFRIVCTPAHDPAEPQRLMEELRRLMNPDEPVTAATAAGNAAGSGGHGRAREAKASGAKRGRPPKGARADHGRPTDDPVTTPPLAAMFGLRTEGA